MPVWHVSIAARSGVTRTHPRPLDDLSDAERARLHVLAQRLLGDIGGPVNAWTNGQAVLHLRRPLTNDERAHLDPTWLALPAIDIAGPIDRIEPR